MLSCNSINLYVYTTLYRGITHTIYACMHVLYSEVIRMYICHLQFLHFPCSERALLMLPYPAFLIYDGTMPPYK